MASKANSNSCGPASATVTINKTLPAPPQVSPQSKTWVTPCGPGPTPMWVAPNQQTGEELVTWADPNDLHCYGCKFIVGPEDPDDYKAPPRAKPVTVPFEIIATTTNNAGPTGVSMLDMIGQATWMIQQLARQRGKFFGLCRRAIRPPCSCGCADCVCGVSIDRTWLPSDVYAVLRVRINGFEIPEWQPVSPIAPIVTADPEIAEVRWSPIGWQITGVSPGTTSITWSRDGAHGPEMVTTSIEVTAAPHAPNGANSNRATVAPGRTVAYSLSSRQNWRIDRNVAGQTSLARLDPYAACGHVGSSCACSARNPERLTGWPHEQRIDLPATEDCTWEIEVLVGEPVPQLGRQAVADLACELAKDVVNDDCRVPPEVTRLVRSGVTIDLAKIRNYSGLEEGWGIQSLKRFMELSLTQQIGYLDLEADPWGGYPTPAWNNPQAPDYTGAWTTSV